MRGKIWPLIVLVAQLVALGACAPKAAPAPAPAPQISSPAAQTPSAPAISPEQAAWARTVEEARKEGMVNTYSIILAGDVGRATAQAFYSRYGIKLNIVIATGAVSQERIKSEQAGRKYTADTLDTSLALAMTAKESQLTQAVGYLPVLEEKGVWLSPPSLDLEGHFIVVNPGLNPLMANTNLVKPADEPKSWLDLLDAKWKGKMGLGSPEIEQGLIFVYMVRSALSLDEDYFRRLGKQELKVYMSSRDPPRYLAQGDIHLAISSNIVTAGPLAKEGAPIKALPMKEGTTASPGSIITLVKGAPHPNAARVFINWLLSPEGQQVYTEARGIAPNRKDVADHTPASLRFSADKVIYLSLDQLAEVSRMQREGTLALLMGLKK